MRKGRASLLRYLLGAAALGCVLVISPWPPGVAQQQGAARSGSDVPAPSDINVPPSEMRSTLERFAADRGNLIRSFPVAQSPARRSRFKQFYTSWQSALAEKNFEAMSLGRGFRSAGLIWMELSATGTRIYFETICLLEIVECSARI